MGGFAKIGGGGGLTLKTGLYTCYFIVSIQQDCVVV